MAITEVHHVDEAGNPAGGVTQATGLQVEWQNGPLRVGGVERPRNGAFVEDVIEAAIGRLEFYQSTQFACVENAIALGGLQLAAEALKQRTRARTIQGVEGTHSVHT